MIISHKTCQCRRAISSSSHIELYRFQSTGRDYLDTGIGETFNARVAGNIANDDLIGSLEFASAAAGAKVILVMGHTACGAIKGAIDNVELGNLTGLLNRIKPAIEVTQFDGEKSSKNEKYVDAVAKTNVKNTMDEIRKNSEIIRKLEQEGKVKIVGSMYNLNNGEVEFSCSVTSIFSLLSFPLDITQGEISANIY